MDWTVMLPVLLTGGVFLIGLLSFLLVSFKAMFNPLQKDISRLDMDIKANKQELKADLTATKQELKAEIQIINAKLDQLISVTTNNKKGT